MRKYSLVVAGGLVVAVAVILFWPDSREGKVSLESAQPLPESGEQIVVPKSLLANFLKKTANTEKQKSKNEVSVEEFFKQLEDAAPQETWEVVEEFHPEREVIVHPEFGVVVVLRYESGAVRYGLPTPADLQELGEEH